MGGLDALVNNAGVASFGHFASSSEAVLRTIMEVNFFAPAEMMRLAAPLQKNRAETPVGWQSKWLLRANRFFPRFVDRMMARKVRQPYS